MEFFDETQMNWHRPQMLPALTYKCGFCSNNVSSEKGIKIGQYEDGGGDIRGGVYFCPSCKGPTFITPYRREQIPQPIFGNPVARVPKELEALYDEARKCTGQSCFTAAVLVCRKILMNIAVNQGANEGLRFIQYVDFLGNAGFIPPNGRQWVDHIRKKGNEATHEIDLMEASDARDLLTFVEMLLKFIYEFPSMVEVQA